LKIWMLSGCTFTRAIQKLRTLLRKRSGRLAHSLAESPLQGHLRRDLTKRPVRFWTLPKYPNYLIVYNPDARPLAIVRVLHGMRDLKRLLKS
jgi:plasmid stabilization system protein ParE